MAAETFKIAQISDIHLGDPRFEQELMDAAISEINAWGPDVLIVAGDLTSNGYLEEFEAAKAQIGRIDCRNCVVIAGNHDCRNVGYLFFEQVFGARHSDLELSTEAAHCQTVRLMAVDSNKPDLNDGEVGRERYPYIEEGFKGTDAFKVFILHHHLVSIPGTGRERNIVWDSGDLLQELAKAEVDLVLSGHKHVPYIWQVDGMYLVTSGMASTRRTRGFTAPAYNMIEVGPEAISVCIRTPGAPEAPVTSLKRNPERGQSVSQPL